MARSTRCSVARNFWQNEFADGTIVTVGTVPLIILILAVPVPHELLNVAVYTPVLLTVIDDTLFEPVLQLKVPTPNAVRVTLCPGQIVEAEEDKLKFVEGPATTFIEFVTSPQPLLNVAVYIFGTLTDIEGVFPEPLLHTKVPVLPAVFKIILCPEQITVEEALIVKAGAAPDTTVAD